MSEAVEINQSVSAPRIWALTIGGVPASSLDEAEAMLAESMANADNLNLLAADLWRALEYTDPEERIDQWISREPVAVGIVEFFKISESAGVSLAQIGDSNVEIGELIIKATAGVMMRGGLTNHFHYLESGKLVINPDNPPNLTQAYEMLSRTIQVKDAGEAIENYTSWTLGMLGDSLEAFFGDSFDPTTVMAATARSYNTYITSVGVYRAYWDTKRALSFTHHKEVYYAKLDPVPERNVVLQNWVLDTSERLKLTVGQQRKVISFVRAYGNEGLDENQPENSEEMLARMEVRAVSKNFMFYLNSTSTWYEFRGPFEHIPNGASPIINTDSRTMVQIDGRSTKLNTWTRPGEEVPGTRGRTTESDRNREARIVRDNAEVDAVEIIPPSLNPPLATDAERREIARNAHDLRRRDALESGNEPNQSSEEPDPMEISIEDLESWLLERALEEAPLI